MKIILYSTVGCHLCEQAKQVLWPVLAQYQYRLVEIDIADDDYLIERYGTRIPVLAANGKNTELGWPFSSVDVESYFEQISNH